MHEAWSWGSSSFIILSFFHFLFANVCVSQCLSLFTHFKRGFVEKEVMCSVLVRFSSCWFLIHILVVWKWLCDNPNGKKYHNHIIYNNMTAAVLVLCWCFVWWSKVSFLLPYFSFVMALMPMIIMGNRNQRQQRHLRVQEGTWNHIAVIRSPW